MMSNKGAHKHYMGVVGWGWRGGAFGITCYCARHQFLLLLALGALLYPIYIPHLI